MSGRRRPKAPTPRARRLTGAERRELDALAAKILAGDAEAVERFLMKQLYGKPTETDVEPLSFKTIENDSPVDQEPGP